MKSQMRMRHYCDFCKRSSGQKPAMAKHEAGCTNNPDRVCKLCECNGSAQEPLEKLFDVLVNEGFPALQTITEHCPGCILATLRQLPVERELLVINPDDPKHKGRWEWDFKAALKEFWDEVNANRAEDRGY